MLVEALVLAMMGWLAIARSLRPMVRLSTDIEQRSPEHLGAVDQPDIPREVAPLVTALNGLFARVVAASAAEKAFIADAAHRLRTPLTALRTETELALLESHVPQTEALLRRLHLGTTRAARLANQLLSQARAEHVRHNSSRERFDLKQIATEAAEEWVARSVDAGVDLGFELESARVDGHGFLLREMLANLLDNAINYAGPAPASPSAPARRKRPRAAPSSRSRTTAPASRPPTASAPSSASSAATPAAPAAAWACPSCATSPATTAPAPSCWTAKAASA